MILEFAGAALGLAMMAAGMYLIRSSVRRAKDIPASQPPVASTAQMLPVLLSAQVFEQTRTAGLLATIEAKLGFSQDYFQRCVEPVLTEYAGFVQQLPASDSAHSALPGGCLIRALNRVAFALSFRRGQILPRHAAPEDIMRLEHRWTYAVFMAALLHDVGRLTENLRVTLYGPGLSAPRLWTPHLGSMGECGGTQYQFEVVDLDDGDTVLPVKLAASLFRRWIPEGFFNWLSTEPALVCELLATLEGGRNCGSGAIGELVSRAQAEWLKRNVRDLRESGEPAGKLEDFVSAASTAAPAPTHQTPVAERAGLSPAKGAAIARQESSRLDQEEYLDDVEVATGDDPTPVALTRANAKAPLAQLLPPVTPALPESLSSGYADAKAPSEAALRFMSWLQTSLASGSLAFNQTGAMVHFVKEGMLLVSPRIFQRFAKAFGEDGRGAGTCVRGEEKDLGMTIQRQCLKAGWHLRGENGINILTYQARRAGKSAARICGVVVGDPQRFVSPVPPVNPHVEKAAAPVEGAKEHGLSA